MVVVLLSSPFDDNVDEIEVSDDERDDEEEEEEGNDDDDDALTDCDKASNNDRFLSFMTHNLLTRRMNRSND